MEKDVSSWSRWLGDHSGMVRTLEVLGSVSSTKKETEFIVYKSNVCERAAR